MSEHHGLLNNLKALHEQYLQVTQPTGTATTVVLWFCSCSVADVARPALIESGLNTMWSPLGPAMNRWISLLDSAEHASMH